MLTIQRLLYLFAIAVVELTPPAVVLTLAGSDPWLTLLVVVVCGTLVTWAAERWLPVEQQRPWLLVGGLVAALWFAKGQVGGGAGLLSGWNLVVGSLLGARPGFGTAYLALLLGLYSYWRGLGLRDHDTNSLRRLFSRVATGLILLVLLGAAMGGMRGSAQARTTLEVIGFFSAGLLAIALGSALAMRERGRQLDGRGTLTIMAAIAVVIGLGVVVGALFGGSLSAMLGVVWNGITLLLVVIFAPLFVLIGTLVSWVVDRIRIPQLPDQPPAEPLPDPFEALRQLAELVGLGNLPQWVLLLAQGLLALIPLLLVVLLVLFVRRRRPAPERDEERESLFSWGALQADVGNLLGRLRGRPNQRAGLRAALASLHGNDPVSRIRRSYIRLLLYGEAHEQARTPEQTPHEYAPQATTLAPDATTAVATLTAAYERARYYPDSTTAASADAAEQAWQVINERQG